MEDANIVYEEITADSVDVNVDEIAITTVTGNVVFEEKPKKKKKEIINKITCSVNYNIPKKNKTSILYNDGGSNCSVFIDGIYNGTLEIEYVGDKFTNKNIKKVNAL